jgi:hypothetical protein
MRASLRFSGGGLSLHQIVRVQKYGHSGSGLGVPIKPEFSSAAQAQVLLALSIKAGSQTRGRRRLITSIPVIDHANPVIDD